MKKNFFIALAFSISAFSAFAQTKSLIIAGRSGMYPSSMKFAPGEEPQFKEGVVLLRDADSYVTTDEIILKNSEKDQIGEEHFRYQQTINGIPVEGAIYVVHVKNHLIKSQNGEWIARQPITLANVPVISEGNALLIAQKAFGAKIYKWQLPSEEAFIKRESGNKDATFFPKSELVYYSGENEIMADKIRLAYKLDLYAHEPTGRHIYFVDAETGIILGARDVMHTTNANGTAVTAYSGTQNIVTDNYAGGYRLQETLRGSGIQTFNLNKGSTYSTAVDFLDSDNTWNNVNTNFDEYAADAHWGAEKAYDYFKNTFNRNSIDNAGFAIKSYVHYSTNYFNAFWDGTRMTYGDGNALDNFKPLTAIDVCGHEITHGLTAFTAALNYNGESGALNEGFSDIFGTVIEHYAKPTSGNWLIGEAFYTARSMSDPNAFGQPDTYQGTNWATGTADYGGVHTNSGVINFWFYLLTNGGVGVNDKDSAYTITGIGMTKAAAIAYRTLTIYLTPTSQYANARNLSIQAAVDLYGSTANEVVQVTNAWAAVGVGSSFPPPPVCGDVYEPNEAKTTAKSIALNTDIIARIGTNIDKDWFSFVTASTAPKVKLTLANLPNDYDLRLYDSKGKQIGISQKRGLIAESISYNAANVGATYYVQVSGYNKAFSSASCYTLRAATSNINQLLDDSTGNDDEAFMPSSGMPEKVMGVYPNPVANGNSLHIDIAGDQAGVATLQLYDITGKRIVNQERSITVGLNSYELSIGQMPSGIYMLRVITNSYQKCFSVSIQ